MPYSLVFNSQLGCACVRANFVFWILNFGFWIVIFIFSILNCGSRIFKFAFRTRDQRLKILCSNFARYESNFLSLSTLQYNGESHYLWQSARKGTLGWQKSISKLIISPKRETQKLLICTKTEKFSIKYNFCFVLNFLLRKKLIAFLKHSEKYFRVHCESKKMIVWNFWIDK